MNYSKNTTIQADYKKFLIETYVNHFWKKIGQAYINQDFRGYCEVKPETVHVVKVTFEDFPYEEFHMFHKFVETQLKNPKLEYLWKDFSFNVDFHSKSIIIYGWND